MTRYLFLILALALSSGFPAGAHGQAPAATPEKPNAAALEKPTATAHGQPPATAPDQPSASAHDQPPATAPDQPSASAHDQAPPATPEKPRDPILLVGTYTNNGSSTDAPPADSTGSKGIYVYRWDEKKGTAHLLSKTPATNPSYLTLSPDGRFVYACTQSRTQASGSVTAYALVRPKGRLIFLNQRSSNGANPVYVSVHPDGRWLAVANYTGGNFSVYSIDLSGPAPDPDGKLTESGGLVSRSHLPAGAISPANTVIFHHGRSIDTTRQTKPHIHSVLFSPDGHYLYVQDLGIDKVLIYPFSADKGFGPSAAGADERQAYSEDRPDTMAVTPGSGPRHLVFEKDYVYLLEEMGGQIDVYRIDHGERILHPVQRIPTHPLDKAGPYRSADLHVSPDGHFLYASNRESENNIAIFSIDPANGKLTTVGYQPCLGIEPRSFLIDPSGDWLLVGNQLSNQISIFRVDKETGLLTPVRQKINVPSPTCLKMIP